MKTKILFLLPCLWIVPAGCSSPEPSAAAPSARRAAAVKTHKAVKEIVAKMLISIKDEIEGSASKPRVVIRPVDNETTQSFNTFEISDRITGEVRNSGLFRFEQAEFATSEDPEPGTDYIIAGKIQEVKTIGSTGKASGQNLTLFLHMVNYKTGQLMWMGDIDL